MRYGLLSYPGVANLGDAIQSLAAKRFLPQVDIRIPRERISDPPDGDGPVRMIANGWYMHETGHWPPHSAIEPLLVSMHFAEKDFGPIRRWRGRPVDRLLAGPGGDWLRRWGPVGARDEFSVEELGRHGIPAYLSGCLTLTLPRPAAVQREDFIVGCDLSVGEFAHLERSTGRRVIATHHGGKPSRGPEAQEQEAEAMLDLYARAAAVVTTRVHAALPCLALGTPVLFIAHLDQGRRVRDVTRLLHHCQSYDFLRNRQDFDVNAPPPNPETFRPLAQRLQEQCRAFVAPR